MLKQKIDNGVKGSPGRFPRPRFCQFEECGEPTTGYKYCRAHAAQVKVKQKAESWIRLREINRETRRRKRDRQQAENETRLAAIKNMPPMFTSSVYTSSDLLHMPPDRAARAFNAILRGDAGMVR